MKYSITHNLEHINLLKNEAKKIVFTNGCFDLLHVGHIRYLSKAKELGDYLIVGLNSDKSVKNLKGENRPINIFEDRAKLLMALTSVDMVLVFEEQTPKNLIQEILPDILVKGGDYKIENIVGSNTVIKNGGNVKVLQFHEGYSSSSYISKIKTLT
jgi:D-beta-D-heptose 7-phosphate kinase/D-beta-D-heptose 1-phosphate adenosyltransferase